MSLVFARKLYHWIIDKLYFETFSQICSFFSISQFAMSWENYKSENSSIGWCLQLYDKLTIVEGFHSNHSRVLVKCNALWVNVKPMGSCEPGGNSCRFFTLTVLYSAVPMHTLTHQVPDLYLKNDAVDFVLYFVAGLGNMKNDDHVLSAPECIEDLCATRIDLWLCLSYYIRQCNYLITYCISSFIMFLWSWKHVVYTEVIFRYFVWQWIDWIEFIYSLIIWNYIILCDVSLCPCLINLLVANNICSLHVLYQSEVKCGAGTYCAVFR